MVVGQSPVTTFLMIYLLLASAAVVIPTITKIALRARWAFV